MHNIEDMTFEQLFDHHEQVIKRLRYLGELRTRAALDRFQAGDHVRFDDSRGRVVSGIVVRVNKKSLTLDTKEGRWSGVPPFAVSEHIARVERSAVLDEILKDER